MDVTLIQKDWEALAGKRMQFVHAFYQRLFEQNPDYRALFPASLDAQMEKMVEMFSSVARFADHTDFIRPYLVSVGFAHRKFGIRLQDAHNFKKAFVETLAHLCEETWDEEHERSWTEAFDDMLLPMFDEGLETGRQPTSG